MAKPLVSVVIPAYNHERFVGLAIDSVLNQTCSDLELVVVDDGSTDNTGEVVKGYSDARLQYYHQENQDAYNAINRGISLTKGSYIAILNSDDLYTLDRLETLLDVCKKNNAVCAFSDVIPIDDENITFDDSDFGWNIWHKKNRDFYYSCNDLYTAFLKGNFMVTTSNLFMTAEAARDVGTFCSLRYLHDYDFIFRMIRLFPQQIAYVDDRKLVYYRIHGGNTLGEAAIAGREQDRELIAKYMLAAVPEKYHQYVKAGSERLVELERELHEVRTTRYPPISQGVRPAFNEFNKAVRIWLKKKFS
ncbi:MAG: glycosyltransferase [Desulfobacterales bacterium]|nr:glycosyltransferase [Desulfobacterales bacterium]